MILFFLIDKASECVDVFDHYSSKALRYSVLQNPSKTHHSIKEGSTGAHRSSQKSSFGARYWQTHDSTSVCVPVWEVGGHSRGRGDNGADGGWDRERRQAWYATDPRRAPRAWTCNLAAIPWTATTSKTGTLPFTPPILNPHPPLGINCYVNGAPLKDSRYGSQCLLLMLATLNIAVVWPKHRNSYYSVVVVVVFYLIWKLTRSYMLWVSFIVIVIMLGHLDTTVYYFISIIQLKSFFRCFSF